MYEDQTTPTTPQPEPINTPVPQPVVAPVVPVPPVTPVANTAGAIVLQWLTYAFWGWTILSLGYLVAIVASYALDGTLALAPAEPIAYGIAAAFILLPISFICDVFYSKREPQHKHGAAMVVMVIHAVIFALLGIGALIAIAFSLVNLVLTSGGTTTTFTVIITAATMFVLYGLTLIRTIRPLLSKKYRFTFRIVMTIIAIGLAAWGIVGPVAQTIRTKDDRAVQVAVNALNNTVGIYSGQNNALPKTIDEIIDTSDDYSSYNPTDQQTAKDLAARGLITYTPNTKQPTIDTVTATDDSETTQTFYYQLCAVYKYKPAKSSYYSEYKVDQDSDGYSFNIDTSRDVAGKNCYKLKTTSGIQAVDTDLDK